MSKELKLCPFCPPDLGVPEFVPMNLTADPFSADFHWKVRCQCCGCSCGAPEASKEAAAEVWNTRHKRTCRLVETEGHHETDGKGWLCSECGYEFDEYQKATALFCQSCGAQVVS